MLEKRTFELGIDMDSALHAVMPGFARMLSNCLISNGVDVTNIKGNVRADFETLFGYFAAHPTYSYRCLGSKYDPIFNKVYFFVKCIFNNNSSPDKSSFIFEYDVKSGVIYVVCDNEWDSILDFDDDELITGISIVFKDTTTPLLYWSQRAGLRKINVLKAKLYFSTAGADPLGYSTPSLEAIERIKYPTSFAPEIKQLTDTTFIGNNIQKDFFQFSIRNVFDDYEVSVPSDWSRVNIPYFPYEVIANDIPLFYESQRNNLIEITIKKPFETVEKLELLVRQKTSDVGTEINYDWLIYDTIIVSETDWGFSDELIYKFYNDKVGRLIVQSDANKVQDNVPRSAVGDTFAEDSRIYNGNIVEGFDLETIDIDVSHTATPFLEVTDAEYIDLFVNQELPFSPPVNGGTGVLPTDPTDMQVGGTISFQFNVASIPAINGNYNFQYILTEADLELANYPELLLSNMQVAFNSFVPSNLAGYLTFVIADDIDPYTFYVEDPYPPSGSPIGDELISAFYKFEDNCVPQFKNRHIHYLGIGYGDDGGRRSSVQKISKYYLTDDLQKVLKLRLEINHVPPIWATQYYIYYAGFDAGNFYQTKVTSVGSLQDDNTRPCVVDWLQTQYKYKDITYLKYSYSVGDRIKFLYASTDGELEPFLDLAILSANADSSVVNVENSSWLTDALLTNTSFVVEIYKKQTFSDLYYTISKNDIGDAGLTGRYHKGNIQDQSPLSSPNPAIQELEGVNTYIRPRYTQNNFLTNIYTFYNFAPFIIENVFDTSTSFVTRFYIYKDAAKTQLIATFDRTIPMSVPGTSFTTQFTDELLDYLNDPTAADWTANDPSYTDYFFLNNYVASYVPISEYFVPPAALIVFTQRTSSDENRLYFNAYSTGNNTTDSVSDDAQFSQNPSGESQILYLEDPNQSDIFVGKTTGDGSSTSGSAVTSFGKPNIENPNFREVHRENTIWHTGEYIPESNINGLSTYDDGWFKDYSQSFGAIYKLFSTDRHLKVYMENRVGWIGIKQYLTGGNGANLVLNNATILTTMEYYQEKRGIGKHPESHAEFAGREYFVDTNNGAICRISMDGVTVLSDVKNGRGNYLVRQWLYDLIKNHTGNFPATYNAKRDTYEVVICDKVVVWNEQKNTFLGVRSYVGESLGTAGQEMIVFKNGRLYLQEANERYNNFFGVQYNSSVQAVGNLNDSMNKAYKNLWVKSSTAWSAPRITNSVGQLSILQKNNFKPRENKFWAAFLRDKNTKNVTYPIFSGNVLRDIAILIKLENDNLEEEVLKYIEISFSESK